MKFFYFSCVLITTIILTTKNCECQAQKDASQPELEQAIDELAMYLVKQVKKDGTFHYRINMDTSVHVRKKYNILRHAGSIFSLCSYYKWKKDKKVLAAIKHTGKYLQESIRRLHGRDNISAIWSDPRVNGSKNYLQAKLGGTGIGLVALMSIEEIEAGFTPVETLQELGRFLVFMQKEDGSFYSKYIPAMNGRTDRWTSLFYPGEAALGLLMLYEKDRSLQWHDSALKALKYLANKRKNAIDIPVDHWALLATEKLLNQKSDKDMGDTSLLIKHAVQICEKIIPSQIKNDSQTAYIGGFHPQGKTTPTSTRLEGLLAALKFIPQQHEIHSSMQIVSSEGIDFLLRAWIKKGEFVGAIPRAVVKIKINDENEEFNKRATEVRIDYVQHALSAMLEYQFLNHE